MKLLVALMLLMASPALAARVECVSSGNVDGPAIQASLDAGGTTELVGVCVSNNLLTISQLGGTGNDQGETLLLGGVLYAPGIVIDGARRVRVSGTELRGAQTGITVNNAILVRIENAYITSSGDGIVLNSIAAVWIVNTHINGLGEGTYGIKAGYSQMGFEALWVLGSIIETHDTGIWMGGWGNVRNVTISDTYIDRTREASIQISPQGGSGIYNVQIRGLWANGSGKSVNVDTNEGQATRVTVQGAIILGLSNISRSINKVGVIYGPQEPGN